MIGVAVFACMMAGCAGSLGAIVACLVRERSRRSSKRFALLGVDAPSRLQRASLSERILSYCERLGTRMASGATTPISPSVRAGDAEFTRAGAGYLAIADAAGCSQRVGVSAYCEARNRLTLGGALVGAFLGCLFSAELAALMAGFGAAAGRSLPAKAAKGAKEKRAYEAKRHLSEMLEVVALGLRSGLTFDRSFELYGSHFDGVFAESCARAHRNWTLGLVTREEALRAFALSYGNDQLSRMVESTVRSLKFGTTLSGVLEEAAAESRAAYRAALEERIAKAPVKMMLPTGTLILPAMLLLVMGPIMLELAGGF